MTHYPKSLSEFTEAQQYIWGGVKKMNRFDTPEHFPLFFEKASGPHVWDVDHHQYIDLIGGKGSIILGYADKGVNRAVKQVIDKGSMLPLTSSLYLEAAKKLRQFFNGFEKIKFFRSGSCGVTSAVRLSRIYNGKNIILTTGYHGWHDWFIIDRNSPHNNDVHDFHYSLGRLKRLVQTYPNQIAAIVVTPLPGLFGPAYYQEIQAICSDANAVFILDEVKTGFRFPPGGFQKACGLSPHLTIVSKAIANGFALCALGGREDIMAQEAKTHISGTYETENIGLAAGINCMQQLQTKDYTLLKTMHEELNLFFNDAFQAYQIPAQSISSGYTTYLFFETPDLALQFYRKAAEHGVTFYYFDEIYLSFSHQDVGDTLVTLLESVLEKLSCDFQTTLTIAGIEHELEKRRILPEKGPDRDEVIKKIGEIISEA